MTVFFVSGTGTGVGKTFVTRGLARSFARRGIATAAVKPIETGCDPDPLDALALAHAAGRAGLAHAPGFFRARAPLAPYAAALGGEPPPPLEALAASVRASLAGSSVGLVEGAGGLLVPYDRDHVLADLAVAVGAPLILVAVDALGTLSHTLAALEAATARGLATRAIVLSEAGSPDASQATNRRILAERAPGVRVVSLPRTAATDDAIADALDATGLPAHLYPS